MRHYIYIPGLGDYLDPLRRLALHLCWRDSESTVTFVPMQWGNRHETYEEKYQRVAQAIEAAGDDEIVLVGESAAGAMALLVLSRNPGRVERVITICGYNHGAKDVHPAHQTRHPAFYKLIPHVDTIVAQLKPKLRDRITTIYSLRDKVVIPDHSRIEGAKAVVLHTPGHFSNIARVILAGPNLLK